MVDKMKSKIMTHSIAITILITFLFFSILPGALPAAYAEDGPSEPGWVKNPNAWVLVDEVVYDGSQDAQKYNKTKLYQRDVTYRSGDYTIRSSYVGDTNKAIGITHGESMAVQAIFKGVPDTIYADQPVTLDLSLSVIDNSTKNYDVGSAVAKAHFAPPDFEPMAGNGGYPNFENANGKNWFELSKFAGFDSIQETLTAQMGEGEGGEQIVLYTELFFSGVTTGTKLIYEWQAMALKGDVGPRGRIEVPKSEEGEYIDSGYRISEAMGEVLVRRGDDRLGWEMAFEGDVLYEGDVIMTKDDSAVIISCPDMTQFNMTSNSSIGVDIAEKESTLKLLLGKVMTNVKKMIKDGSMNVEMSQCVAGIKGTILICETDETTSSVQVIEGEVEVTDLKGEKVILSAGELVTAQDGVLGPVQEFSVDQELQNWPEETRKQVYADIAERTGKTAGGSMDQNTSGEDPAARETAAQGTGSEETDYKELFEEKIADHESHVQSKSLLKYFLLIIGLGVVAVGVLVYMKKRQ